eukprot:5228765-Amphidinium_carterae.1
MCQTGKVAQHKLHPFDGVSLHLFAHLFVGGAFVLNMHHWINFLQLHLLPATQKYDSIVNPPAY